MSKTTNIVTKAELLATPLPEATETYTVISHEFAINNVRDALLAKGFTIIGAEYRANADCNVARGTYTIEFGDDPEMKMLFLWVNSYDKSTKFQCGVGAVITSNGSYMISKEMTNWVRKHTGTADTETLDIINEQVGKAEAYFTSLIADKNQMMGIEVDPNRYGAMLGRLYINSNALSTQQLSAIKKEFVSPTHNYETGENNLWTLYNHILVVLRGAHPKNWLKQQTIIHYTVKTEFCLLAQEFDTAVPVELPGQQYVEPVDPNQTNIIDQIEEIESTDTSSTEEVIAPVEDKVSSEELPVYVETSMVLEWNPNVVLNAGVIIDLGASSYYIEEIKDVEGVNVCALTKVEVVEEISDEPGENSTENSEEILLVHEVIEKIESSQDEPFITDQEEDDVMDQMLTPMGPRVVVEEDKDGNPLVSAQPIMIDYSAEPRMEMIDPKSTEELVAEHNATHDDSQMNVEYVSAEELVERYGDQVAQEEFMKGVTEDLKEMTTGELFNIVPPAAEVTTEAIIEAFEEIPEKKEDMSSPVEQEAPVVLPVAMPAPSASVEPEVETAPIDVNSNLDFNLDPDESVEEDVPQMPAPVEETFVEDPEIKKILANEIEELFGEAKEFTYVLTASEYVMKMEDGSELSLDVDYIQMLQ